MWIVLSKRVGDPSGARNSMRTAVDSSILLDEFVGVGPFVGPAQRGLQEAIAKGSLIVGAGQVSEDADAYDAQA